MIFPEATDDQCTVAVIEMDSLHPEWGNSPYRSVRRQGTLCLKEALEHLYVLLPVLDGSKHYCVNASEIDRFLRGDA